MAKTFGTFEHTADVGLSAEADTLGELFEALAMALARFICPAETVRPDHVRQVAAQAEDVEALAVDFLSELLRLIQVDRRMVSEVNVKDASAHSVRAEVHGERYDPSRHEIHTEVKAVTYHQLKVAEEDGRWMGRVILDL